MSGLRWNDRPSARLFQVFNRQRRSCGTWTAAAESKARTELAAHPGGYMLILDEYTAKLPHLGHCYRVVVDQVAA